MIRSRGLVMKPKTFSNFATTQKWTASWKPKHARIKMVGNGATPMFHVKIWNHPIETAILKWMFRVPG